MAEKVEITKTTVNLGYVWNSKKVYYKGVPKELVYEDAANFYDGWSKSESYQCM
jgi:hypothetical protein